MQCTWYHVTFLFYQNTIVTMPMCVLDVWALQGPPTKPGDPLDTQCDARTEGILDVWPLQGPPRKPGDPLDTQCDARTEDWHTVCMFLALILPTLNWNGGGTAREFVGLVLPKYGSRNREWFECLQIPKELWSHVNYSDSNKAEHLIDCIPNHLRSVADAWCACHNSSSVHTIAVRGVSAVGVYHQGCEVLYYDGDTNMSAVSRRSMLCRFCMARGCPGYLLTTGNGSNVCNCDAEPGVLMTRCHRCAYEECFLCALQKNKPASTTWPARPN